MSLRKKIANSHGFNSSIEGLITAYVKFCYRSSDWTRSGFGPMEETVKSGEPVIMVLWHQRLIMSPYRFDSSLGRICTLTSDARAGRLAGKVQERMGFDTIPMSSHKRHVALSREVLRRIKGGSSVGIAADGPRGPARVSSSVPIIWARSSGCRIFTISFAQHRTLKLPTWDKQMLPVPFSRGVLMCDEWKENVPRKPTPERAEELRLSLEAALNRITDACDTAVGRS